MAITMVMVLVMATLVMGRAIPMVMGMLMVVDMVIVLAAVMDAVIMVTIRTMAMESGLVGVLPMATVLVFTIFGFGNFGKIKKF